MITTSLPVTGSFTVRVAPSICTSFTVTPSILPGRLTSPLW